MPPSHPAPTRLFDVREKSGDQRGLWSLVSWAAGDDVTPFEAAATHAQPARLTLQASADEHIELSPQPLSFLNHSCDPSVFVDTTRRVLVALRPIAPGDELTFFYPSTEWAMAEPFRCQCGAAACLGTIAGARDLPADQLSRYRINAHIHALLERRGPRGVASQ
jgi:hypothetical protein